MKITTVRTKHSASNIIGLSNNGRIDGDNNYIRTADLVLISQPCNYE